MRVGIDATPLLGPRTGIGRYVGGLLDGLQRLEPAPEIVLTPFTWRGTDALPGLTRGRRAPARMLQSMWSRSSFPPVEWLSGPVDVFHGTNFVVPPTRSAGRVVSVHDLSFLRHADTVQPASLRYQRLVPRAIAQGAVVCALTQAMADEIAAEYGTEPVVAYPGVDPLWFDATPPTPDWLAARGLPARYVVAVGSLEPRKGLHRLVEAMAALHRTDPHAPHLVLVGPAGWGPVLDSSSLPRTAVHLMGYLGDDELCPLVAGADVLAFPSTYEGFGLPPLEALAAGTRVVVTDLAPVREVLGTHATYVPVGDIDALAAALVGRRPTDTTVAREHARTFTWKRCAEQTMTAYQRALG